MSNPICSWRHWSHGPLTFCEGDGTRYEVKLAPIRHLTTDLRRHPEQQFKPRGWWYRWRHGIKGAW